ncbi:MAG: DUF5047 domain-containing protein, partial [Stackebrandtia sp.]
YTQTVTISSPMTPTLLRSVSGSHAAVFDARVITEYQVGDDPDGVPVPVLGGDVRLDGTAEIRGTLDLETDGDWPKRGGSLLAPYGNEIFVRRGIDLGSEILWVPLGYYRIDDAEQDDPPDGPIQLSGSDRMAGIVDARLPEPRQYDAGATVGAIFRELVGEIYPGAVMFFANHLHTALLGRSIVAEEDRYAVLRDIAEAHGCVIWFDGAGVLQFTPPPDPGTPAWEVAAGTNGALVSARRRLTRDGVYNGVVATAEGADTTEPIRALVVNSNPRSATFWGGRFGKVPRFYSSPLITTQSQARSAAQAMLQRSIGFPYSVDLEALPNPALRPDDPVRVIHADGAREVHVVESVTIPLSTDAAISVDTKEQTRIVFGEVA